MRLRQCQRLLINVASDVGQNNIFSFAAALSYYFVLAFFPAVITLATIVGHLPIPNLFNTIVDNMARVLPHGSMGLVYRIVNDVVSSNRGALLSFGLLGTLWTCSSGFATMIEALNVAYQAEETRPMWKTRLLAFELTFLIGFLVAIAFAFMIVGPLLGRLAADYFGFPWTIPLLWTVLRHVLATIFIVLAIEGLYFLAPNIKQSFASSLPGAIFSVIGWILLSDGLSLYFEKFAHLNRTYGVLGGGIALLVWLYWSSFVVLLGAQINFELLVERAGPQLPTPEPRPPEAAAPPAPAGDEPATLA